MGCCKTRGDLGACSSGTGQYSLLTIKTRALFASTISLAGFGFRRCSHGYFLQSRASNPYLRNHSRRKNDISKVKTEEITMRLNHCLELSAVALCGGSQTNFKPPVVTRRIKKPLTTLHNQSLHSRCAIQRTLDSLRGAAYKGG